MFLSFCRGNIPKVNRTEMSPDCQILPALLNDSMFSPLEKTLRKSEKVKEWRSHPFPDVELPTNCYVVYSTLPDSK